MNSQSMGRGFAFLILIISLMTCLLWAEEWSMTNPTNQDLYSLWGSWDGDLYAAGENGILISYNGASWSQVSLSNPYDLNALWGTPASQVFSAGDLGKIYFNDGLGRWYLFTTPVITDLYGLWGSSASDVYAVGALGKILFFNGSSWQDVSPSTTSGIDLYCIWGADEDHLWAGGTLGKLFLYNGAAWNQVSVSSLTSQTFRALWGSSASDIFAAGTLGSIIHYDGSFWSNAFNAGGLALYALWGLANDDIFAAGQNGKVYHYDGHAWSALNTGYTDDIRAIWGSTSGTVFFAGDDGSVLVYDRDDEFEPVVRASDPIDGSTGVYITTPVVVSLSEEMDPSTVTPATVTLTSASGTVSSSVTLDGNKVTITPKAYLAGKTQYTATITTDVQDLSGNPLASPYSVSFTTEDASGGSDSSSSGCFIAASCLR
ncbi:MAG TPA: Ig-like domain-containing protein [Desulfomonilia bacterium]|nr:Ig-like domain-containing protein [Desulfomonilia bacterium]